MKIRFTVFGNPQGKARPRFTMTGHAYTPEKTREYERQVKQAYKLHSDGRSFEERPVAIEIIAFFPIPKSASKQVRTQMERGELYPTRKPDCDNVVKVVCDALNGLAYKDDAQVVAVTCQKHYGLSPSVHVVVTDWEEYT